MSLRVLDENKPPAMVPKAASPRLAKPLGDATNTASNGKLASAAKKSRRFVHASAEKRRPPPPAPPGAAAATAANKDPAPSSAATQVPKGRPPAVAPRKRVAVGTSAPGARCTAPRSRYRPSSSLAKKVETARRGEAAAPSPAPATPTATTASPKRVLTASPRGTRMGTSTPRSPRCRIARDDSYPTMSPVPVDTSTASYESPAGLGSPKLHRFKRFHCISKPVVEMEVIPESEVEEEDEHEAVPIEAIREEPEEMREDETAAPSEAVATSSSMSSSTFPALAAMQPIDEEKEEQEQAAPLSPLQTLAKLTLARGDGSVGSPVSMDLLPSTPKIVVTSPNTVESDLKAGYAMTNRSSPQTAAALGANSSILSANLDETTGPLSGPRLCRDQGSFRRRLQNDIAKLEEEMQGGFSLAKQHLTELSSLFKPNFAPPPLDAITRGAGATGTWASLSPVTPGYSASRLSESLLHSTSFSINARKEKHLLNFVQIFDEYMIQARNTAASATSSTAASASSSLSHNAASVSQCSSVPSATDSWASATSLGSSQHSVSSSSSASSSSSTSFKGHRAQRKAVKLEVFLGTGPTVLQFRRRWSETGKDAGVFLQHPEATNQFLHHNDRIIRVNGNSLLCMSNYQALSVVRDALADPAKEVTLGILRFSEPEAELAAAAPAKHTVKQAEAIRRKKLLQANRTEGVLAWV
eukprot:m.28009 g.28009  ORF g.28009 m.28009 type:complete len:699 (-) comp4873_c0_seq1:357-2453(-)